MERAHQELLNSKGLIFRGLGTNVLSALMSADAVTLQMPRFGSAAMGRDQDGEYRLYAFWLEETPTIDEMELRLDKINSSTIITVPTSDMVKNVKASEVSVVMVASWIWSSTNSIWNKLEKISNVSEVKIRLLKDGSPITGWNPVSFYRLDHWMGSKEATEVTMGPSTGIKANN